ncbi:flagellin [Parvularcula sp. LCG005]|uniref:flagellin n=1 Tax=Parvularcula sp. LCG005 TaxID=3078805 RepID=UPI002941EF44|nr:flagellin [Parvularcula sp. LCG005]WOI52702.1 flagellin [Parvularcula sp. LCG005]
MISTYPDAGRLSSFYRVVNLAREQLAQASTEMVTGQKANPSRALADRVGEYNLVSKALVDIDAAKGRLGLAENRLAQTSVSLDSVRSVLDGFSTEAVQNLLQTGEVGRTQTQATARSNIEAVMTFLNTRHGGRSLFAGDEVSNDAMAKPAALLAGLEAAIGSATDAATINTAIADYFAPGGGFETDIYEGGSGFAASVELSNGSVVDYGIRADDQAFKDTLEGLARLAFIPDGVDFDWAEQAVQQLGRGESAVVALQADIGRQQRMIEENLDINAQEKIILTETSDNLIGVDALEAATRVQTLEAQLEAAYTVTARLARLTFTDYIR